MLAQPSVTNKITMTSVAIASPEDESKTVTLNVGGTIHQVSRSLIEIYPNTMLGRMIDKVWEKEGRNSFYIDRDGERFRYVLDYMRDGEIHVPMTVSRNVIQKELEYYGFENVRESTITAESLAEARKIFSSFSENMYEEVDAIDNAINECKDQIYQYEIQKSAIKTAHTLYVRSASSEGSKYFTVRLTNQTEIKIATTALSKSDKMSYLKKSLHAYGFVLEKVIDDRGESDSFFGCEQFVDFFLRIE